MNVEVVILGSGTSVPHPDRGPPAFLVRAGDTSVLVDCGAGASTALARAGVTLDALDAVLLSHFHLDHTVDLPAALFALCNPVGPRRTADLPIWGPRGLLRFLSGLADLYGDWVAPANVEVVGTELDDGDGFHIGSLAVEAFEVQHSGPSLAYRLAVAGRVVCISGDSGPCDGLLRAADGADLLVCECGALESEGLSGHMSATEVGALAVQAGCRRVVLTHLYQRIVDTEPVARVRALFDGEVILGDDGMRVPV